VSVEAYEYFRETKLLLLPPEKHLSKPGIVASAKGPKPKQLKLFGQKMFKKTVLVLTRIF